MSLYRLLRSNKESGPYSLNDLVTLGLKPYDLIWVDGRSAAWRYPSEILELKEYAPVVEEQPFDRFFKKPSAKEVIREEQPAKEKVIPVQKSINESLVHREPVKKTADDAPTPSFESKSKKPVFVSMPETNGFTPYKNPYDDEKYEQYLPKPEAQAVKQTPPSIESKSYSPINIQESDNSKLETKYTQSLDDIKEMYINTLVQRKTKNRRKEIFKKYIRPAIAPVALLTIGVVIGYMITSRKKAFKASHAITTVVPSEVQTVPQQKNEEQIPADKNDQQQPEEQQNNLISPLDDKNDNPIISQEKKPVKIKQESSSQKQNNTVASVEKNTLRNTSRTNQNTSSVSSNETAFVPKRDVEVDPQTGERKSVTRNTSDITSVESNRKSNSDLINKKNNNNQGPVFLEENSKDIHKLVSVKSNDYMRGAFGGIKGLKLTVYNNSNYLLDEVKVELQIMKPSEQPLRTDVITFKNVAANGAITVKVPDSQRGIRVDYRITNIESKQWQKNTAGL
jgi:hypothetical protein